MKAKPECVDKMAFLTARLGKSWAAPFTGYDARALKAFIHLLECWSARDYKAEPRLIQSMRELVLSVQQKPCILVAFREVIAGVLNWGDIEKLWPLISVPVEPDGVR